MGQGGGTAASSAASSDLLLLLLTKSETCSPQELGQCGFHGSSGSNLHPRWRAAAERPLFGSSGDRQQHPCGHTAPGPLCGSAASRAASSQAVLGHGSSRLPAPSPPRPGRVSWATATWRVSWISRRWRRGWEGSSWQRGCWLQRVGPASCPCQGQGCRALGQGVLPGSCLHQAVGKQPGVSLQQLDRLVGGVFQ